MDKSCGREAGIYRPTQRFIWEPRELVLRAGVAEQSGGGLQTPLRKAALHGCKM